MLAYALSPARPVRLGLGKTYTFQYLYTKFQRSGLRTILSSSESHGEFHIVNIGSHSFHPLANCGNVMIMALPFTTSVRSALSATTVASITKVVLRNPWITRSGLRTPAGVGMTGSTRTFHPFLRALDATSSTTMLCRAIREACVLGHDCKTCPSDPTLPHASQAVFAS